MLKQQNNCCAICERHEDSFTRKLAVDHCHKTGRIRGLLCRQCNSGIGLLKESIVVFNNAIDYIKKYEYT